MESAIKRQHKTKNYKRIVAYITNETYQQVTNESEEQTTSKSKICAEIIEAHYEQK